jgi:UTP-glucose-1-phosphate uridylyltransferase
MEAREFSTAASYTAGEYVLYSGILYKFIANHSAGAWNEAQVTEADDNLLQEITRIIAGKTNAEKAADFADTLVMDDQLISGTRYKYIFTNAPDPRG